MRLLNIFIPKQGFDQVLAVVKCSIYRQIMHVRISNAGHLAFLDQAGGESEIAILVKDTDVIPFEECKRSLPDFSIRVHDQY